ncbi:MAG TPA: hypothetical protein IAB38_06470 [Candidatus Onthousia excrementipullorum]|uniref:Uncharacterized protein n=1 Tax=Candidatus Onthousia excrementipullorum TaxID=2840884 RepID=A0A9D1J3Q7_9FIRM|nr:hypothetical protein [Candidatus Onthousia excrementipullorum]
MEKKTNKGLVITIILLLIIIGGLVFYICYDKGIVFSSNDNEKKQEDIKRVDENSDTVDNNNNMSDNNGQDMTTDDIYNQKKCYGTYYGEGYGTYENGISWSEKATYVLNTDGTFTATFGDAGASATQGIYVTIGNTIIFIRSKDTFGPKDQDPYYYAESYVMADDCSYFIKNNGSGAIYKIQSQ